MYILFAYFYTFEYQRASFGAIVRLLHYDLGVTMQNMETTYPCMGISLHTFDPS